MKKNNIIKLVFIVLISMVLIRFISIIDNFINISMIFDGLLSKSSITTYVIFICESLLALGVFICGLLSMFNKKNKALFLILAICGLGVMIAFNAYSIIQYIGQIKPGDSESIQVQNYNFVKMIISCIIENIISTAGIVFACLILNLNEGEIINEEKCTKELC